MIHSKLTALFHDTKRQHRLWLWTVWMFVFLAVEKVLAGAVVTYEARALHVTFSLSEISLICVAVYTAMAILLALRVKYIYLLFPDFVLFGVKLYTVAVSCYSLIFASLGAVEVLSAVEAAVESVLFSLFLFVLFAGKLGHPHGRMARRYPLYCMRLLLCCFAETLVFEIVKCIVATELHQYPLVVAFNFFKGVAGEALLDVPYYLLISLLCFVPQKHGHKHI